jgi:hypothetical protein
MGGRHQIGTVGEIIPESWATSSGISSEGIANSMYCGWSKEFLEAGKRWLAGDQCVLDRVSPPSILSARRPSPKRPADDAPILHPNIRGPRYYN